MGLLALFLTWLSTNAGTVAAIGIAGVVSWIKTRIRQTILGPIGLGLLAVLAVVIAVGIVAWHHHSSVAAAVSAAVNEAVGSADNRWKAAIAEQNRSILEEQRRRDQRASDAAAAERRVLEEERDAAKLRAQELERQLAETKDQDDPVIYPKALARRMRK